MRNFDRDSRPGDSRGGKGFGKRSFGGGRGGFGGRDGARPQMHQATCGKCGQDCQVPFRPTGDRPVFCKTCFDSQGGNSGFGRPEERRFERPSFEEKRMHDATCAKCGSKCQVPFRPIAGKPVFCSQCFEKGGNTGSFGGGNTGGSFAAKSADQYKEQFEMLNSKLDRIIRALSPATIKEPAEEEWIKTEMTETKKGKDGLATKKVAVKKAVAKKKK